MVPASPLKVFTPRFFYAVYLCPVPLSIRLFALPDSLSLNLIAGLVSVRAYPERQIAGSVSGFEGVRPVQLPPRRPKALCKNVT